jgi:hypothetical protein
MSLTTTQFANDYVNALVAQGVALSNATAFKTTFANQLTDWLGGEDAIPADLAYRLTTALARINAETASRLDWLTGTTTGGPNSDGYYAATAPDGSIFLFPCLAKMLAVLQAAAGSTNLSASRDASSMTVISDTGQDATLPAATTSLAGVMTASDKSKLNGIPSGGGVGVTNLSASRDASSMTVFSDTGLDANLPAATASLAGVMSAADKTKLDGITGTGGSGSTNLSFTRNSTSLTVVSDTGTDAVLPGANVDSAGIMSAADKTKLDGIPTGGATNLSFTRTSDTLSIFSDTGNAITLPVANVDSAGIMSAADKTKLDGISSGGQPQISRGAITGLTLANDGTSPNTHVTIATGQARSSTDAFDLRLTTGLVKRLDQAWAIGTNNGALDTGSVAANTGYHVFLIRRTSDGVLDVLMSTSATNPTLPSGFGAFRRLGAVLTDASGFIRKFVQRGDYFELYFRTADFAGVANGAGPDLRQMVCPKGVPLKLRVYLQSQGGTQLVTVSGIFDPGLGVPQLVTVKRAQIRRTIYKDQTNTDSSYGIFDGDVWCDANGQVYTHSDNTNDIIALGIYGWTDERGQYQ